MNIIHIAMWYNQLDTCVGSCFKLCANFMKCYIQSSRRVPVTWPTIAWEILRLLRKVLISSFTRLLSRLYESSREQKIRIFRAISQWFKTQGICSNPPRSTALLLFQSSLNARPELTPVKILQNKPGPPGTAAAIISCYNSLAPSRSFKSCRLTWCFSTAAH